MPVRCASSPGVAGPPSARAVYRPSLSPITTSAALVSVPQSSTALPMNALSLASSRALGCCSVVVTGCSPRPGEWVSEDARPLTAL